MISSGQILKDTVYFHHHIYSLVFISSFMFEASLDNTAFLFLIDLAFLYFGGEAFNVFPHIYYWSIRVASL